jgi:hypothetical protein
VSDQTEEVESGEFSWRDANSIVVHSVSAIAVYMNPDGDVVIRQQATQYGEDDPFIVIPRDRVPQILEAIGKTADEVPLD